jgi:hypothetical protein
MTDDGDYPEPGAVRGMGSRVSQDGESNHFPTGLSVIEGD